VVSELDFQTMVLKAFRAKFDSVYACKLAHKYLAGIPDLMVVLPNKPVMFIEMKMVDEPKKSTIVKVATTELQRNTMQKLHDAGAYVRVWVVVKQTGQIHVCHYLSTLLDISRPGWDRTKGTWPVDLMMHSHPAPHCADVSHGRSKPIRAWMNEQEDQ